MNATEAMKRAKQGKENIKVEEYQKIIERIRYASKDGYTAISIYDKLKIYTIERLEAEGYYVGERRVSMFSKRGYVSWNGKLNDMVKVSKFQVIGLVMVAIYIIYLFVMVVIIHY